jgi:DNA-binding MarR family transcriptional regulator
MARSTTDGSRRTHLIAQMTETAPRLATDGVFLHQAIADHVVISATDLRCLEAVTRGPATVGELGQITGLATGATTRMIDRLEAAGFVSRRRDPSDRRRVVVVAEPDQTAAVGRLYDDIAMGWRELLERYSDDELQLLAEFLERVHLLSVAQITQARHHTG